eukprot:1098897_1
MSLYLTIWLMLTVFTTIGRSATNEDYLKGIFFIDGSLQNNDHHIQMKHQHSPNTLCPPHQSFDGHSNHAFLFEFECEWLFIIGTAVLFVATALFMHQSSSSACALSICVLTSLIQVTHALNATEYILDEPLRINQAIKVTGDGFTGNSGSSTTLYIITIYHEPSPGTEERVFRFRPLAQWDDFEVQICHVCPWLARDLYVSSDANDAIELDFKLTSNKWEIYTFGKRIPEYDYNEIGWDANVTKVVVESMVNPVISIGEVTSIPSNVTPGFVATIIIFILLSVAANAACIFFFYWKFKRPRKQTAEQEPTGTKTETKELKTKEANDDTEAPKLTEAGQTTIDTEVDDTETKDLKTEERTKTTASDEPQEAKEPVWNRYLKIALPFTFLVEDYAALMLEDPDKTYGVDIALVITLQFLSVMVISWCSECCVRSVPATIIPKVLTIAMEYLFAILLISYCTYVPLAGFIIGGLTILQVVSEIMSIIFDHETKETIWICPPFCKWCGLPDEPEDWEEERQLRKPELQSKFLVVMAMFMFMAIFFFLFGAIYVGSGCTHVSFAYLWTLGMFMFDRLWNTPALEIRSGENEWRKKLLIVQFAGFFLFMLVSTFLDPEAVGLDVQSQERMHTYDCTVSIGVLNLVRYYMIIIGLFLLFAYTNSCIFIFIQDIWFSILLRLFAYVSSLVFYCCGVQLECEHN